jgi:1-acyl-sn-glycerol-3-phosphate acyltransferase
VKKLIARALLWLLGWKPEGRRPTARNYVLIAAPHTSNWDLPIMLALAWAFDVEVSWMGKHTLFAWPYGWLMRFSGGIPICRDRSENRVQQMARAFAEAESLALGVSPEGTRSYVPDWKSGFYHIALAAALAAKVPIVMGYVDFARKRGGFGPELVPSGGVTRDMDKIRRFYSDKAGKYPDCFGNVRLKEES